jgi:hypothetical protein
MKIYVSYFDYPADGYSEPMLTLSKKSALAEINSVPRHGEELILEVHTLKNKELNHTNYYKRTEGSPELKDIE